VQKKKVLIGLDSLGEMKSIKIKEQLSALSTIEIARSYAEII